MKKQTVVARRTRPEAWVCPWCSRKDSSVASAQTHARMCPAGPVHNAEARASFIASDINRCHALLTDLDVPRNARDGQPLSVFGRLTWCQQAGILSSKEEDDGTAE